MRISDWSSDVCSSDLIRSISDQARIDEVFMQVVNVFDHPALFGAGDTHVINHRQVLDVLAQADPTGVRTHLQTILRSEEHTSELQSLMRISYAVFCLKKKIKYTPIIDPSDHRNHS